MKSRKVHKSSHHNHKSTPRLTTSGRKTGLGGSGHLIALGLVHGLLFALAFPPLEWWPLAFVALFPLGILARIATSTRSALAVTFLTQLAMWLWINRWITQVTPLGYIALSVWMSVWPVVVVWGLRRLSANARTARWPATLTLPVLWVAMDFARGEVIMGGYPWFSLGSPLINWPAVSQFADLFGIYGCSFVAALSAGLLIDWHRSRSIVQRRPWRRTAAVTAIMIAIVGYGHWRLNQTQPLTVGPRLLAIQTNLPQSNKIGWTVEAQARDVPGFMDLTRRALEGSSQRPDLIVWPETMLPSIGFEPDSMRTLNGFGDAFAHLLRWPREIEALSRQLGIPLLVGTEAWLGTSSVPTDDGRIRLTREYEYNSAYLIQGQPPYQRYDKVVLTPFGERMPLISNWEWLERKLLALGAPGMSFNLDQAEEPYLLTLRKDESTIALATPICFEDTVSWLCRTMAYQEGKKRIDLFVSMSNDGWFGWSEADRRQHVQMARWRCIENRVPMVRSVNTGLSVHLDSCGRIVGAVGSGRFGNAGLEGCLEASVNLDRRVTVFDRGGWLWPWLVLIVCVALLAVASFPKSKDQTHEAAK